MTEESQVKVLRRSDRTPSELSTVEPDQLNHYSAVLSNGRRVTLREMTASDLLFVERQGKAGDTEKSLRLIARISVSPDLITYDELSKLRMKDLKVLLDLLNEASNSEDDPN